MSNHGTPLPIGHFAKLSGAVIANLPREMDDLQLALDLADNGEALRIILLDALTRAKLDRTLAALGKKTEPEPVPLLQFLAGTITVASTAKLFNVREHFIINTEKSAAVKIPWIGDNFKEWFLGKTEAPFPGSILNRAELSRSSVDGPIIKEIGGDEKAETTLTEVFSLMLQQPNGENGTLLTNRYANIFYVKDVNGVLRAVGVHWYSDGWHVYALSVARPVAWRAGGQVFSRNSRSPLAA
jgi:hypothetical protein